MSKFWIISSLLLVIGAGAVLAANFDNQENLRFTDLETECQVSEEATAEVLYGDGQIVFEGNYPERDADAKLSYNYRQNGDSIVLNVKSKTQSQEVDFMESCLASVVYRAETVDLEKGIYDVVVKHDGKTALETSIRVS